MAKNINDIYNECLDLMQMGETIEGCLGRYPEYASELQPMLSMYLNVRWRGSMPQPRPEFKAQARTQFIQALQQAQQTKWEQQKGTKKTFFRWHGALVPTLAAVLLMLFSGFGTVAASSNALPEEPLYPVKIATEKAREILTFSAEEKAELQVSFVENRVQEIEKLAEQGKTTALASATTNLVNQLDQADLAIKRVEADETGTETGDANAAMGILSTPAAAPAAESAETPAGAVKTQRAPPQSPAPAGKDYETKTAAVTNTRSAMLKAHLNSSLSNNITVLERVLDKVPESAKSAIQNAIDTSNVKRLQNSIVPNTSDQAVPAKTDASGNEGNSKSNSPNSMLPAKTTTPVHTTPAATTGKPSSNSTSSPVNIMDKNSR